MRKTVLAGSVLTALIASSAAAAPASAAVVDLAVADRVVIDIVAVAGCPAGTAMVEVSPDNTSFRLWFSALQVQIGPHTSPAEARRTCQVALGIHVPAGHTYAIDRIQYGGYTSLAPGAVFTQRARQYRSGQVIDQPFRSHSWTGPMVDEWQAVDTFTADELYFPACGTNPNFNAVLGLRLDAGTSDPATETSFAALDSVDGPYGAVYRLQTRPC